MGKSGKSVTAEQERLHRLLTFDRDLLEAPRKQPVEVLIGTDEVGRGCLAGPVVAAAVILPRVAPGSELALKLVELNDSKQVKPKQRAELSAVLSSVCRFSIAEASAAEVDEHNVLYASLMAMRRAIRKLNVQERALIAVDGNHKIKSLRIEQVTVVAGDSYSASIAAASIIAKVYRDNLMQGLAKKTSRVLLGIEQRISLKRTLGCHSRAWNDALPPTQIYRALVGDALSTGG